MTIWYDPPPDPEEYEICHDCNIRWDEHKENPEACDSFLTYAALQEMEEDARTEIAIKESRE